MTYSTSNEEFVRAWMAHDNLKSIAAELKADIRGVSVRACKLRKLGVALPKKHRGPSAGPRPDVKALNKLIKESR